MFAIVKTVTETPNSQQSAGERGGGDSRERPWDVREVRGAVGEAEVAVHSRVPHQAGRVRSVTMDALCVPRVAHRSSPTAPPASSLCLCGALHATAVGQTLNSQKVLSCRNFRGCYLLAWSKGQIFALDQLNCTSLLSSQHVVVVWSVPKLVCTCGSGIR